MTSIASLRAMFALVLVCLLSACDPVLPQTEYDDWQFEGFQVYSHVPDSPRGLVYFFHGSLGSADFVTKVETVDLINDLIAAGYAFVATESTDRSENKRWALADPSLVSNPDLARLARLQAYLVDNTAVTGTTPIFGVGMSNGARMVSLFGQSFADAGYPVTAVAPFMAPVDATVRASGGLRLPAFFVLAENDSLVPNDLIELDVAMTQANGVAAELWVKHEEPLKDWRFTRVPSIDAEEAALIVDLLVQSGAWNAEGERQVPVADAALAASAVATRPRFAPDGQAVGGQLKNILAEHGFSAINKLQLVAFFNAQLE
ncbi:MAG: hypothetical protein KDI09_19360 [Halioglobus sp.]|nr:hypothetical protein [Halioglobus sp.]